MRFDIRVSSDTRPMPHSLPRPGTGHLSRRRFLHSAGAAIALPIVLPGAVLGRSGATGPNGRIVVGMIGSGERANQLADCLLGMTSVQVAAACDPCRPKREALKDRAEQAYAAEREQGSFKGCGSYNDFRDLLTRPDIDAVVITSPEHWHALQAIAAAKAKKDIYLEKAMTRTVAEGQALIKAVRENAVVLQVGQQQRSDPIFRLAVDLALQGELGELRTIQVGVPGNRPGPTVNPQPVPEGLDYDLWLGPAPVAPYQPERLVNMVWMSTYDYCIGYQAGWGAHHVDIAQWGIGPRHGGVVEVESTGRFPTEGICDCPLSWKTQFTYPSGLKMIFASEDHLQNGIRFDGSAARVHVNRARIECGPDAFKSVLNSKLPADYQPGHRDATAAHLENFFDCMHSRRDPAVSVEVGHRVNTACCLSDIATRLQRTLRWDSQQEHFLDDPEANQMLSHPMRPPWSLPG